jgi:hypothetical protein
MQCQFMCRLLVFSLLLYAPATRASGEPFEGFIKRFLASCMSERKDEGAFYLSRIHLPLKYAFTAVGEKKKRSAQGILNEMKLSPDGGGFALPVCIGDGGLEETKIKRKGNTFVLVELTFGSGPNEELRFKLTNGIWKLVYAEWIDH